MGDYRSRNRQYLVGVEAVPGTEEALVVGTDSVKVENPVPSNDFEVLERNEAGGSLDSSDPVVGGGSVGMAGDIWMKGSGAGGTAPEYGPILRACAMAETLLAADETATAQAGSTSQITLAVGASAVDDFYKGMVIEITGGAGAGDPPRVVTGYDGTTKIATVFPNFATAADVTSVYNFRAHAMYVPASTSLETVTAFLYDNSSLAAGLSRLRKVIGAVGTASFELTTAQFGKFSHTLTGILPANPTDVAAPGAPTFDPGNPPPILLAESFLGQNAVKQRSITFDLSNNVQQSDDPAAQFGRDVAGVTERNIVGQITPNQVTIATRDPMADFLAGTPQQLWLRWGSTLGNRLSVFFPSVIYTGNEPSDQDGFAAVNLPFKAGGFDDGVYLEIY
jgi:hypothetical protein